MDVEVMMQEEEEGTKNMREGGGEQGEEEVLCKLCGMFNYCVRVKA